MNHEPADRRGQEAEVLIYIVDDDRNVAEVVEAVLYAHPYKTQIFDNPHIALNAFLEANPKPDLLFTDYMMGDMNGLELIEKCKRAHPPLKTILYSGTVGESIQSDSGIKPDDFISKPFNPRMILEMVRSVLAAEKTL